MATGPEFCPRAVTSYPVCTRIDAHRVPNPPHRALPHAIRPHRVPNPPHRALPHAERRSPCGILLSVTELPKSCVRVGE